MILVESECNLDVIRMGVDGGYEITFDRVAYVDRFNVRGCVETTKPTIQMPKNGLDGAA